jgi:predicted deacylase
MPAEDTDPMMNLRILGFEDLRISALVSLVFTCALATTASAQAPFTIQTTTAAPGSSASGAIVIAARAGDEGTTIPFTIINGASAGPVLALVAGTHGMEYPPILAGQRLLKSINPATLRGTIVLVETANMPSFLGRTIYYSPVDHKNLNRVFPGKPDGTISERIAHAITTEVIMRATHLIDMHCGDGNEWLRPYLYWIVTGDPKIVADAKGLALAFGFDHIVMDRERPVDPNASVYLSNTAQLRGKPALTIESGGLGKTDEPSIAAIERGVRGVMKHLKMTDAGPDPIANPTIIDRNQVLTSGATGLLYPQVQPGQTIAEGALFARVTDFHGTTLEEIRAPFAGEVLYIVATPPINKGEPVGFIGEIKK